MEPILIENLISVAIADKCILFVREQDKEKQDALGIMVQCDGTMSYSFGLVQQYMKFWTLDILEDNKSLQEYYQDRISKTFQGKNIYQMLTNFAEQIEKWNNLENKYEFESTLIFKTE